MRATFDLSAGDTLADGRYRIDGLLGRGGMGAVYEGTHLGLNRRVAIKVLSRDLVGDVHLRRFQREAVVAGELNHPHIVQMLDVCASPDQSDPPFLVMERLEGRPLIEILQTEAPLDTERGVRLLLQLLSALEAAHEAGVVHRDLKPGNLFVTKGYDGGEVLKVLDFGVARLLGDTSTGHGQLTDAGQVLGTFSYMAPEQANGDPVDARADIYAVGVVAWVAFVGRPAFTGNSPGELLRKVLTADLPRLVVERPELGELARVVDRAMSLEARARYASANAMAAAIRGATRAAIGRPETRAGREAGGAATLEAPAPARDVGRGAGAPRRPSIGRWAAILGCSSLFAFLTAGAVVMLTDAFREPAAGVALVGDSAEQSTDATLAPLDAGPVALMQPPPVVPEPLIAAPADAAVARTDTKPPGSEPAPTLVRPAMRRSSSSMTGGRAGAGQLATMWVSGTSFVTPHSGARNDADAIIDRAGIESCWPAEVPLVGTDSYYLTLTILSDGSVASANLTVGMVQNGPPGLLPCVRAKLRALSFPSDPANSSQRIEIALTFRGI